jgi:hypothetical protein
MVERQLKLNTGKLFLTLTVMFATEIDSLMMRFACTLLFLSLMTTSFSQTSPKTLAAKRTTLPIIIDGNLNDTAWKNAAVATGFTEFRPTPFRVEDYELRTEVYMLYSDEGIYIGGYCHERTKDSISAEVNGRDGFGNNDFIDFIFDTYQDKINGFEYFVTPKGEQMDAKFSNNGEDFSWNAVWKSAAIIHNDGWSFEVFLPFSAIRFSKKNVQDWGFNISRRRQKTLQQYAWNPINPNINGFLTQEGNWTGLENIKPPLRLQFSPYLSYYVNHYPLNQPGEKNWTSSVNGGMDVKYGINQAMTLDMTLIPDFGQVQSDNTVLNLSPFEVRYNENRPFFTEGTELFNKGNFFYSRRIGGMPLNYYKVGNQIDTATERIVKNPSETKLINATKISGRFKSGLGIGFFNAIANSQYAVVADNKGNERKIETSPLTNYNIIVLDQSLKHNSSVSLVNTSVTRSGDDYDAYVTSGLFDLYDKKNTWNLGGKVAVSNLTNYLPGGKTLSGYGHQLYFGKPSGRFNFNVSQELADDKFNSNDLGFFTNNNFLNHYLWMGYRWTKPTNWYNNIRLNFNANYSQRFKPQNYQNANINFNINSQLKNLWQPAFGIGFEPNTNNFYEARVPGRIFKGWGDWFINGSVGTNGAKKYSTFINFLYVDRNMFHSKRYSLYIQQDFRFNQKLAISHSISFEPQTNNLGFADFTPANEVIFARRDVRTIENSFSAKYSFNTKMVFNARIRHYWSRVDYLELFTLLPEGDLQPNTTFTNTTSPDYNAFSVDASFNWQFAPGSFVNLVWKNNTSYFAETPYGKINSDNYFRNFNHTINAPQNNNLSIKIIYFLDYVELKRKLAKG